MRTEINSWIERGTNYQEGVSLYEQYGKDSYLKLIFKRNDGAYNRSKLLEELGELRDKEPEDKPVHKPDPVQVIVSQPQIVETKLPSEEIPALLKLKKDISNTWAQIRGLHPYLSIYPEGDQLYQVQLEIVKLARKNTALYEKLDYYHDHGMLPVIDQPVQKPPLMIDINLLNSMELIRKSLNKAENRAKKQASPKLYTLNLIKQRRAELQEIKDLIANAKAGGANG